MKTITEAAENSGMDEKLIRAIVRTVGMDYMEDICNHGADAGYPGITYYRDTVAFYKRHKAAILELAKTMADDQGEDILAMIAGFGCLKAYKLGGWEIAAGLNGRGEMADIIQNAMTWFAAEEAARALCDG